MPSTPPNISYTRSPLAPALAYSKLATRSLLISLYAICGCLWINMIWPVALSKEEKIFYTYCRT